MIVLNVPIVNEWIAALESGEHRQGKGWLRQSRNDVIEECCLGVLCDLPSVRNAVNGEWRKTVWSEEQETNFYDYVDRDDSSEVTLTETVADLVGITPNGLYVLEGNDARIERAFDYELGDGVEDLTYANDTFDMSFVQIAQALRRLVAFVEGETNAE